jgi:hypothetical protein
MHCGARHGVRTHHAPTTASVPPDYMCFLIIQHYALMSIAIDRSQSINMVHK